MTDTKLKDRKFYGIILKFAPKSYTTNPQLKFMDLMLTSFVIPNGWNDLLAIFDFGTMAQVEAWGAWYETHHLRSILKGTEQTWLNDANNVHT